MAVPSEKIALFIDGANLYATAKALGFDIDYKRLLKEFQSRGYLVRAFYYTAVIEDQEYSSIRPLIDWLDYNGYSVVTKATKEFVDQTGRRKVKGNMDIELAVDAMELAGHIDQMVLFSGDGDFRSLVEAVQRRGVRVVVVSTDLDPAADGGGRIAPAGRPVHRHRRTAGQDRPRPGRPRATVRRESRVNRASRASTRRNSSSAALSRNARARRRRFRRLTLQRSGQCPPSARTSRDCPRCPRLVAFRETWRAKEPAWHNAPVPSFGPIDAPVC